NSLPNCSDSRPRISRVHTCALLPSGTSTDASELLNASSKFALCILTTAQSRASDWPESFLQHFLNLLGRAHENNTYSCDLFCDPCRMPAPMYVSMVSAMEPQQQQKELSVRRRDVITGIRKKILKGAVVDMGKKHKKHKGDKHGHEGKDERAAESRKGGKAGHSEKKKDKKYVEKPLKLVLKVGTGEVKELSTARASAIPHGFHEDKADHDKHRDKKKKKKKKNEKTFGPGEEKKKKK
ncbi:hypothetical protein AB205_0133790, partial [Aquarana catesbeiana]